MWHVVSSSLTKPRPPALWVWTQSPDHQGEIPRNQLNFKFRFFLRVLPANVFYKYLRIYYIIGPLKLTSSFIKCYTRWVCITYMYCLVNDLKKRHLFIPLFVGEGKGGMIWENGIETCIISYMKWIASPGSMQDTGCLGLVHWDDPEGWYREGGGRRVQDTRGGFMLMYGKTNTVL